MRFARARLAVATVAALGAAAAIVTGSLAGGASAAAAGAAQTSAAHTSAAHTSAAHTSAAHISTVRPAAATSYVLVSCTGQDQARPSSFVLSCADGNWGVEHITWAAWGSTAYAGTATVYMNDCDPYCASKHAKFYYFPALVTAWRAEALPGHAGMRYFTRLSWIYTGKHCLPTGAGKTYCPPQTGTFDLAPWPVAKSGRA